MRGLSKYLSNMWDLVLETNKNNFSRPSQSQIIDIRDLTKHYLYESVRKHKYTQASLYLDILMIIAKPIESWSKLEEDVHRAIENHAGTVAMSRK